MRVRVLLNNIKVDISDDFLKAKEYFAKRDVDLVWEFESSNITDYKLITQNFGSVGTRYQISGHEKKIVLSKDYITVFVFNGNEFPLKKMPSSKSEVFNDCVLVTLNSYKEGDAIGETYSHLIHELMHAVNQLFRCKFLINIDDPMDIMWHQGSWKQYYKNDRPDDQDSNFGEAWRRMLPYLPLLRTTSSVEPYAILERTNSSTSQITGEIKAFKGGKSWRWFTLELPWKNNIPNVSAIPSGTYKCRYTFSPRFLKYTYEIVGVPNRSGIRIHSANYVSQLNGCVALGNKLQDINGDGKLDTVDSRNAITAFENFMEKREFLITIK